MPYLQLSDGRTVPVEGTNFVIGSDPVCDLILNDEGVAPRQAILQFDDDIWRLATLSLQSETRLNDEPVESIVALQDGDELVFGSASLRWLEKEPVSVEKRFPVWVPVVLALFACVTILGLWSLFNRDNYAADSTTSALTAEDIALATQQAEDVSGQDSTSGVSQTSDDAATTGDEGVSDEEQQDSSASVTSTPIRLKVPGPSDSSQEGEPESATSAEDTVQVPASETEAESTCPHPVDWVQMTVEQDQKLRDIARTAKTQPRILVDANCLPNTKVAAGVVLWVPLWESVEPVDVADAGVEAETGSEAATTTEEADALTEVETATESEDSCPVPDGWVQMAVEEGQKVKDLAKITETTPRTIKDANCLTSYTIAVGDTLWVPQLEAKPDDGEATIAKIDSTTASNVTEAEAVTETEDVDDSDEVAETEAAETTESEETPPETEDSCPVPDDWVQMTVESGQKVKDIAAVAETTPREIKDANCLPNYTIAVGDTLWVPQWELQADDDEETTIDSSDTVQKVEDAVAAARAAAVAVIAEILGTGGTTDSTESTEAEIADEPAETEDTCPLPEGWVQVTVVTDQKVKDLAEMSGTTPREIKDANCLRNYNIGAGDTLWIPPWGSEVDDEKATTTKTGESTDSSAATETDEASETEESVETIESEEAIVEAEVICLVPEGWVQMTVEKGQKVKDIAAIAETTPRKIKDANCMSSYTIRVGDTLWVPQWEPDADVEEATTESSDTVQQVEDAVAAARAAAVSVIAEILGTGSASESVAPTKSADPIGEAEATESMQAENGVEPTEAGAACPVPEGWVQVSVVTDQKVKDFAEMTGTTPRKIKDGNCLSSYSIAVGDVLWVPQWESAGDGEKATAEDAEPTEIVLISDETIETDETCSVPDDWVQITVEEGQKVKDVARITGSTPRKIKDANCLPDYTVSAGEKLWVPQWEEEADNDGDTTTDSTEISSTVSAGESAETDDDTCPIPDGWQPATIEENMKLKDLAVILSSKARVIKEGNCLSSYSVTPGQVIWVPLSPEPPEKDKDAETVVDNIVECPYPENWVQMEVQKGQKLRDIAHAVGVQPWEIKVANCLPDTKVQAGMILWVPRWYDNW